MLAAAAVLAAGCGDDDSPAPAAGGDSPAEALEVRIVGFAFEPERLDVPAGTTLDVVNEDDAAHTLTADDGSFDTGEIAGGEQGTVEIEGSGEIPYHCTIHDYMRGTVVVGPTTDQER